MCASTMPIRQSWSHFGATTALSSPAAWASAGGRSERERQRGERDKPHCRFTRSMKFGW